MSDHREAIKVLRKALRGNVAAERKEKLIKQSAIADGLANNVPSSRRRLHFNAATAPQTAWNPNDVPSDLLAAFFQ
jgi:hypothetical protein